MKRVVLRLLLSCAVGGAAWVGMASALLAWLLPAVDPGTDDLGVGLVAACIFVPTLYLAAVGSSHSTSSLGAPTCAGIAVVRLRFATRLLVMATRGEALGMADQSNVVAFRVRIRLQENSDRRRRSSPCSARSNGWRSPDISTTSQHDTSRRCEVSAGRTFWRMPCNRGRFMTEIRVRLGIETLIGELRASRAYVRVEVADALFCALQCLTKGDSPPCPAARRFGGSVISSEATR